MENINFEHKFPIYLQVMEAIRKDILAGRLKPGGKVPSVRELASQLGVNPNTIQKALSELEREGLLESARTSGRFVKENSEATRQALESACHQLSERYVQDMLDLGLRLEDISAYLLYALTTRS